MDYLAWFKVQTNSLLVCGERSETGGDGRHGFGIAVFEGLPKERGAQLHREQHCVVARFRGDGYSRPREV